MAGLPFSLGFAAGGAATGLQQGADIVGQAYRAKQTQQLIQLEKQKQNLAGYAQFNTMLQTMDPDTLKAMWPSAAKTIFNVDPSDASTKAFYMQAVDGQTQIGSKIRDAFSSINGNDPNDPVTGIMKSMPITSWAQMAKDPAKISAFMQGITNLKLQQGAVSSLGALNPSTSQSNPSPQPQPQPQPGTLAANTNQPVAPAPTQSQLDQSGGGDLLQNNQPQQPQPQAAAPQPSPQASAPSSAGSMNVGDALRVSALNSDGPTTASAVSALNNWGLKASLNPFTKDAGNAALSRAKELETNYVATQANNISAGRLGVERANLAIDQATKTGWTPVTPSAGSLPSGTTILKNPAGDFKAISTNPALENYYQNRFKADSDKFDQYETDAQNATAMQSKINIMRAVDAGGDKTAPPMGTFEGTKYAVGKFLNTFGMPKLAGLVQNASSAEAVDGITSQAAAQLAQEMRKGSMGTFSEPLINLVQTQLPELTDTPDGRNKLMDILESGSAKAMSTYQIASQHQAQGLPLSMPDQTGKTGYDKIVSNLTQQESVPATLQNRLNVEAGTQPATARGQTTTQPAPTPLANIPTDNLRQMIKVLP